MENRRMKHTILMMIILLPLTNIFGQGWERIYYTTTGEGLDFLYSAANKVFLQDDGSYVFMANVENQKQMVYTDANGLITNIVNAPVVTGNIIRTPDQNFVFAARTYFGAPANEDVLISKFDMNGDTIWDHRPEGHVSGNEAVSDLIQTSNGDYVIVGARANLSPQQAFPYISRTDEAGNMLWKTIGPQLPENNIFDYQVVETSDGGFFMAASSTWFTVNNPIITDARKLDANGNLVWASGLDTDIQVQQIALAADGNILILGQKPSNETSLLKIDNTGSTIEELILPFNAGQFLLTSDGGYAFLGGVDNGDFSASNILLVKTDAAANVIWQNTYGGPFRDQAFDFKQTPDEGFIIAGGANGEGENQSLYIIKTDESGNSLANFIQGNILYDLNENCLLDTNEQALEDWIVSAEGGTGLFYASADADGHYKIEVTPGNYDVALTLPNDYWNACMNDIATTVVDSNTVDFAVQSIEQCPLMEVNIQNPGFRLCEVTTLTVLCQNQGTELAEDVTVEVAFADSLEVIYSSVPAFIVGDNVYSFDVGDIDFLDASSFTIDVQVGCDIELMGQSLCVEATIFPDTTCLPIDEMWSGASIELSAICAEEEVSLRIKNVGDGDMTEALQYTVIEDHVIMLQDIPYGPLMAGQEVVIPREANGTFYRIESEQVPNHPGMSMPNAFVEACGMGMNGEISLGFVNQYAMNDADYAVDINCTEVLAAYDPNAKSAFPIGYNDEHYIEANSRIDYVIQFQNTGSDVANKVLLVDRLSEHLNPATIRPGVSSHDYDFELLADGVVQFTFLDIQLPDSTTNEAASKGFVQFSIAQQPDLAIGTVIENTAAIYFDFNPAIFTNTTFHTIGRDFIMVEVGEVFELNVEVKVYPNPFVESATIQVEGDIPGDLTLTLFDANGRLVRNEQFSDNTCLLSKQELSAGTYFYQIRSQGQVLNVGKVIIQ